MVALSPALEALLAARTVKIAILAHLDFASGPMRVWAGYGPLLAGGHTWSGLGEMGEVSGLELPIGGNAPQTQLSLSGVDPALVAKVLGAQSDWWRRTVAISLQHFDAAWQPVDAPLALYTGMMEQMRISASGATRRIEVMVEWHFARRAIPPFSELTDADQQARHAGDRGCEYVPLMQNYTEKWPAR